MNQRHATTLLEGLRDTALANHYTSGLSIYLDIADNLETALQHYEQLDRSDLDGVLIPTEAFSDKPQGDTLTAGRCHEVFGHRPPTQPQHYGDTVTEIGARLRLLEEREADTW